MKTLYAITMLLLATVAMPLASAGPVCSSDQAEAEPNVVFHCAAAGKEAVVIVGDRNHVKCTAEEPIIVIIGDNNTACMK